MDSMSGPTKRFKWSRNSNCLVSSCWGTRHSTAWATLQQVCHFSSYVAFKRNVISPRMLSILHVLFMPLSTSGVDGWYWFDSCFISNAMKRQRWSLLWWLAKKQKKRHILFFKIPKLWLWLAHRNPSFSNHDNVPSILQDFNAVQQSPSD